MTSGWQPIESAPLDQTNIIVTDGRVVGEARYLEECGWYWAGNDPTDYWGGAIYGLTHWMPLPEPPK